LFRDIDYNENHRSDEVVPNLKGTRNSETGRVHLKKMKLVAFATFFDEPARYDGAARRLRRFA